MANIEKSTLRNQHYGVKMELRPKNVKHKWSPVSTVMVIVDTIDQSTEESVYVGTAMIPMYVISKKPNDGSYVTSNNEKDIVLHEGHFQIHLHHAVPNFSNNIAPFTVERIVHKERVPTTSILLRIQRAKQDP